MSMEPDQFYVPPYLGVNGWVAVRLDSTKPNWGVIVRLARDDFIAVALKKLAEGVD